MFRYDAIIQIRRAWLSGRGESQREKMPSRCRSWPKPLSLGAQCWQRAPQAFGPAQRRSVRFDRSGVALGSCTVRLALSLRAVGHGSSLCRHVRWQADAHRQEENQRQAIQDDDDRDRQLLHLARQDPNRGDRAEWGRACAVDRRSRTIERKPREPQAAPVPVKAQTASVHLKI